MFTGIVQGLCEITRLRREPGLLRLSVALGSLAEGLTAGASVAVNGVCLTAARIDAGDVGFDVIEESVARSNLGAVGEGDRVNVERSLRFGDEIGGHVLSGHVVDVVRVARIEEAPGRRTVWLAIDPRWLKYLPYKGFVALDGVSLTVGELDEENSSFAVNLIPETIARTTLGAVVPGALVNLELDAQTQAVVETVERVLSSPEWRARLK